MADDQISATVRRLIAERIDSVPELEAILLLRETREHEWTAEDAGKRLYVSTTVAAHVLRTLADRELCARVEGSESDRGLGDRYRYAPASAELAAAVDELAVTYAHELVAVTQLIHGKPSASVRQFSDAFRLRRPT